MKRSVFHGITAALLALILLVSTLPAAGADRMPEQKTSRYLGTMRVCFCKEFISLREEPRKTSERLAEIPLGAIVYKCVNFDKEGLFYKCEYEGQEGYVLKKYVRPAPEYEPPDSMALTRKMTMEEVIGNGEVVLDWKDYNMSVVAAYETIREKGKKWEVLRIGCFVNDSPLWGHEERVMMTGQYSMLKVFIGGVEDDWQVMLFDGGWGLSLFDLLSGKERWCLNVSDCWMGNGAAIAVDKNGTTYIAGTDGPDPVAVSMDGQVLWQSEISNEDVFGPYEMTVQKDTIQVKYKSGLKDGYKLVTLDNTGELISIRNQNETEE